MQRVEFIERAAPQRLHIKTHRRCIAEHTLALTRQYVYSCASKASKLST
jgi:hypothetical protein